MAEANLIPQRVADLLRLCLDLDTTYTHRDDLELAPLTDILSDDCRELIENSLPEYGPIMVYAAPRKDKSDSGHVLIVGHKARQWYALSYGLARGDFETCMALLRKAADKRRQPWNYWEAGKRGWTISAGIVGAVSVAVAAYLAVQLGTTADILWLILAQVALGVGLSFALVFIPKTYWEQRGRQIDDLIDVIST